MPSLQDNVSITPNGDERKLEDFVASPINVETDFIEKQERQAQIALLKERVNHLPEKQRDVLTAKYLSGEASLRGKALAEKLERSQPYISQLEEAGIANLRKIYGVELNTPQEINLTEEEKIKTKAMLKDLILAELPLKQQRIMLCKFYSPTPKTNEQVAQEIESTKSNVVSTISQSCKKLCTLCDSVKNTKHLKSVLEFDVAEPKDAEFNLTAEEVTIIKKKAVLKDLILAELPLKQQRIMLCKFYSPTRKTNEQVAQEFESTNSNVRSTISVSCKKLCTLCDSVKNIKHLKSILEFGLAEPEKEC